MTPAMELTHTNMAYVPTSDVLDRHDFGVSKHRKTASTGGGRAWSEDEEVYLLQTRLQKMPYKHIAAHLKKTELACRLHYHQLSHGSNRRKRATSMSSGSSMGHSPIIPIAAPSPIQEAASSRDPSPPGSAGSFESDSADHASSMHLPSIMGRAGTSSSHLPAILPKPAPIRPAANMSSPPTGYHPTRLTDRSNLAPSPFPQAGSNAANANQSHQGHHHHHHQQGLPLRLDCSSLPPPPSTAHVDMARLQAIYAQHRSSFCSVIAAEYGSGMSPIVLEQVWKANQCQQLGLGTSCSQTTPITPVTSPNDRCYDNSGNNNPYEKSCASSGSVSASSVSSSDKTRISAILGIDAHPRSPKEREMVRRLEEGRSSSVVDVAAGA